MGVIYDDKFIENFRLFWQNISYLSGLDRNSLEGLLLVTFLGLVYEKCLIAFFILNWNCLHILKGKNSHHVYFKKYFNFIYLITNLSDYFYYCVY